MVEELGDLGLEVGPLSGVPGAARLTLSGKGGRQAVRSLEEAIQPLLDRGTSRLLLDCAAVEFFNSTALGYLIHLADRLRAIGGTLAFSRVSKKVRMTFDLLGLQEFFRFFPDERSAAQYLIQSAPPASAPESAPEPEPEEAQFEEIPEEPAKPSVLAALPSWLDEVDTPAKLPLGHPRWALLAKILFEKVGTGALSELCRRRGVRPEGLPAEVLRRILGTLGSPEEFLELFDEKTLGTLLGIFRVPAQGPKRARVEAIVAFVERSTAETMSEFLRPTKETPPPESPPTPVAPTAQGVKEALENCPFPKLLRSEPGARDILAKSLVKLFGPGAVERSVAAGPGEMTQVDVEVAKKFAILVRIARPLFAKKSTAAKAIESLLGRLVLLGQAYPKGNLFALFVGEIPEEGRAMVEVVQRSLKEIGAEGILSS